ncbi:MAG: hypothetical protein AAFV93_05055 [Chloroflexota bacterium]
MITTLLLIFGFGVSNGQDSENAIVSITIIDDATLSEIFLIDLESILAEYNIDLRFRSTGEPSLSNTVLSIQVDDTTDEIILVLFAMPRHFVDISLILRSNALVIAQAPDESTVSLIVALALYSAGYLNEAEELLLSISEDQDTFYYENVQFILGNIQLLNENYDTALEYYEPLDRDITRENLVWLYHYLGRPDDAYELLNYDIDRLRDSSEENRLSLLLPIRARLFALDFDYDNAIADMDEAIEIAEENELNTTRLAELYTIRGEIIFLIYEWDRVEEDFNTAIELDPSYSPVYFQRGVLFYTMARREDAQADFEQYLELESDGIYAEQAQTYIESIETELEALGE